MSKIITIDSNKYLLPEGMSIKDIQALAGFLITLTRVDYEYCYGQEESAFYARDGALVSIGDQELVTKAEAKAKSEKSRAEYEARKAAEAAELVRLGATQIDIGVQIGWLKSGMYDEFREDIAGVVRASGVPIKVMLELPLLTEEEKELAVQLSMEAGVAYLKNASSGQIETANPESVRYLVARAKGGVLVKASGSIKHLAQARALIAAGASLLGTSAGIEIISDTSSAETKSY